MTLDLTGLDRVLEVDTVSHSARIEAGATDPRWSTSSAPGLTLRHYPQSFEFSTLGGWIATRRPGTSPPSPPTSRTGSGPAADPTGHRRHPAPAGFGRGPRSRAALPRIRRRPRHDHRGLDAPRRPTRFRAADRCPSPSSSAPSGRPGPRPVRPPAVELPPPRPGRGPVLGDRRPTRAPHRLRVGRLPGRRTAGPGLGVRRRPRRAEHRWRLGRSGSRPDVRHLAPGLLRPALPAGRPRRLRRHRRDLRDRRHLGPLPHPHRAVKTAVRDTLTAVGASGGFVGCRFTHVYADGPAPYYTVIAPGRPGAELEQWAAVKAAASDAIDRSGGTTTHHHAVGRDHRALRPGASRSLRRRPPGGQGDTRPSGRDESRGRFRPDRHHPVARLAGDTCPPAVGGLAAAGSEPAVVGASAHGVGRFPGIPRSGVDIPGDSGLPAVAAVGAGDDRPVEVSGQFGEDRFEFADGVAHPGGDRLSASFGRMVGELADPALHAFEPSEFVEQAPAVRPPSRAARSSSWKPAASACRSRDRRDAAGRRRGCAGRRRGRRRRSGRRTP